MSVHKGPEPTKRQAEYLEALFELAAQLGRPPTSGEIASALGMTRYGARLQLQALEEMGLIADVPMEIRSGRWRLTAAGRRRLKEPVEP